MNFSLVVAIDQNRGIGKDGELPWHIPEDLKYFKELTTRLEDPSMQNAVVMGRKTWESIPEKYRPLPERINIVLTRDESYAVPANVLIYNSFETMLQRLSDETYEAMIETVFIIGGQQIFEQAIQSEYCQTLWITHIQNTYSCDTFFPVFDNDFIKKDSQTATSADGVALEFARYERV